MASKQRVAEIKELLWDIKVDVINGRVYALKVMKLKVIAITDIIAIQNVIIQAVKGKFNAIFICTKLLL